MSPNDDAGPPAGDENSTNEPHLGHGLRKLQPLHSAEEIAAQIAADEKVPAETSPADSAPETTAEPAQSASLVDAAEPVEPDLTLASSNNAIASPENDFSNFSVSPLPADNATPSAQTISLADEPVHVVAPVVVGSGIQAAPPANSPNMPSLSLTSPAGSGTTPSFTPMPPPDSPKKLSKLLKFLPVAIIVIILAAGGSAAYAYVKYYQPEHNLETALNNTLQQKQIHYVGTITADPTSSQATMPAYKVTYTGQSDLISQSADVQVNLTVDGVTFPVEARLVNQNLYFKLGNLNDIAGLINGLDPAEAPLVQSLSAQLSNKWIEVDSTLLKQAGATCELDTSLSLSQADMKYLDKNLVSNNFVTIKNQIVTKLNGQSAEEYMLALNDNKLAAFLKNMNQLSAVKAIQTCNGQISNPPLNTKSIADNDITPINIWVDKSTNRIVKLTTQTTAMDQQKNHETGQLALNLSYGSVSISAPQNAQSAVQLLAQIEAKVLSNSGSSASNLQGINGAKIGQTKTPTNAALPYTQKL